MKPLKMKLRGSLVLLCVALVSVVVCVGCQSQTYTPEPQEQTLSSSALGQEGTLRVGVNQKSAPLAGKTSNSSRIVGIDVDVAGYIADELGLKLQIVETDTELSKALEDGRVDMILGVDASDEEDDFWESNVYLSSGIALFGEESESSIPAVDTKPKIAAQASSKSSWRVSNLFGDESLVSQTELKDVFDALANGEARYVAADAVIGSYVSHTNGYNDKLMALLQEPSGYCAGVSKDNTELQSAIEEILTRMVAGGVMDVIEAKWFGTALDIDGITVIKNASDNSDDNSKDKKSKKSQDNSDAEENKDAEAQNVATEGENSNTASAGAETTE